MQTIPLDPRLTALELLRSSVPHAGFLRDARPLGYAMAVNHSLARWIRSGSPGEPASALLEAIDTRSDEGPWTRLDPESIRLDRSLLWLDDRSAWHASHLGASLAAAAPGLLDAAPPRAAVGLTRRLAALIQARDPDAGTYLPSYFLVEASGR